MECPGRSGPIAKEADGHRVFAAELGSESGSGRNRYAGADDSVGAQNPYV